MNAGMTSEFFASILHNPPDVTPAFIAGVQAKPAKIANVDWP